MRLIKKSIVKKNNPSKNISLKKDICTCSYNGRLGNNLFQIATAISYADKHKLTPVFLPWKYSKIFKIPMNCSPLKEGQFTRFEENGFHFTEIPRIQNVILSGYFQSEKYFNISLIKEYFTPNADIVKRLNSKFNNIINLENTVSVHIRRTDYLNLSHCHCNLGLDYYREAMSLYSEDSSFIFFSDDIEWCRNNFSGSKYIFIDNQEDYLDLFLMSLCKHNIIANSSFSWWGAWLNKNKDKKIVSPINWFGPECQNNDTKDLIPDGWVRI